MRELLTSIADTMASSDPVRAKAAKAAMASEVHRACKPRADKQDRASMLRELWMVVHSARPRLVRAHALALIGFIGTRSDVKALSDLTRDPELGQDAKMARTRILRA